MKPSHALPGIRLATALLLACALGCSDDPTSVQPPRHSELSDSSFAVGDSSALEISNFAGNVEVRPGEAQVMHVEAEKWARRQEDLAEIDVEMVELQNGVRVATADPMGLNNVSVDIEVTAPADVRPTIEVGAGFISYEGLGEGECSFATAAGTITLRLPADVDVELLLSVGVGDIRVDFPVVGEVTEHVVDGVIGAGAGGRIVAQVGAGSIVVTAR